MQAIRRLLAANVRASRLVQRIDGLAHATLVAGRAMPVPKGPTPARGDAKIRGLDRRLFPKHGSAARVAIDEVLAAIRALQRHCDILARYGRLLTASMVRQARTANACREGDRAAGHDYENHAGEIRYLVSCAGFLIEEADRHCRACDCVAERAAGRLQAMIAPR